MESLCRHGQPGYNFEFEHYVFRFSLSFLKKIRHSQNRRTERENWNGIENKKMRERAEYIEQWKGERNARKWQNTEEDGSENEGNRK